MFALCRCVYLDVDVDSSSPGLPGSGKTHWAEKFRRENPEKNYNVLGTNNLIEKMKVDGLSRKRNYHGRSGADTVL